MVLPFHPSAILPVGIAAFIAWRVYTRTRRMLGRQRFSSRRPWFTVCLFPLLILMLLLATLAHAVAWLSLVVGVAIGAGLGFYGLRLTRFEVTPTGLFYTPNTHLGIALSLLFIGRIVYRVAQLYVLGSASAGPDPAMFAGSPLTLAIFGTLAGYYVAYAAGLLRWQYRVHKTLATDASGPA